MCCFLTCLKLVLYSRNLSRKKTFANFKVLLLCTKVFFAKLASFGDNTSEQSASFPHKNPISTDSRKFSPLKVFDTVSVTVPEMINNTGIVVVVNRNLNQNSSVSKCVRNNLIC